MAVVVLTKVCQLLTYYLILCLTVQSYILLFPFIHSRSPLQTIPCLCSELAQLQGTYILQGLYRAFYFLVLSRFCCIVCITFFWSIKHLGDYDLKVMRQEYYINRQKTVSSFSRYTYHADIFMYPFFLVFSYWFCPILASIIKIRCPLYA